MQIKITQTRNKEKPCSQNLFGEFTYLNLRMVINSIWSPSFVPHEKIFSTANCKFFIMANYTWWFRRYRSENDYMLSEWKLNQSSLSKDRIKTIKKTIYNKPNRKDILLNATEKIFVFGKGNRNKCNCFTILSLL